MMQSTKGTMLTKGKVMQIKKLQKNVCLLIQNVSWKVYTLGICFSVAVSPVKFVIFLKGWLLTFPITFLFVQRHVCWITNRMRWIIMKRFQDIIFISKQY